MSSQPSTSRTLPFVRGGIAGVLSWLVIHPADVIKVRMQITGTSGLTPYRGVFHAVSSISRTEGVRAMYSGLSAALTRQITYTTLRLGIYQSLRERRKEPISLADKFLLGTVAGGVASAISTPVEVSMVRMYADGAASAAERRGYRNIGDALWRIGREEGLGGLWKGATPTIVRSCVANCVQLGVYDHAKGVYGRWIEEGVGLHLSASVTSGFWYSAVTMPIDVAKTRLQNERGGGLGLGGMIWKVGREDGVRGLWRGFMPYFGRCAGHTVAMFLVLEQVKKVI